jgi:hypothetical protein
MRRIKNTLHNYLINGIYILFIASFLSTRCHQMNNTKGTITDSQPFVEAGIIESMGNGTKWSRCFMTSDKLIYFKDSLMSRDGGKTLVRQESLNLEEINGAPERAVLSTGELFYALDGPTEYVEPGVYRGRSWISHDNLKTLKEEEALFHIPEGAPPLKNNTEWYGLFVYRTILLMPDSTWLMTMYGNFISDTLVPYDADAKKETRFMQRTFIVTSKDKGHTWNYLSTVAAPEKGDPVAEGLVEPAITILNDGRLLCVMRSGHHYPLYSSWSSDNGKTWTPPLYTGLDRGCDPCLITMHDGRVALSWGRRFPEGWSQLTPDGDKGLYVYPGEGYTTLSISSNGGLTWNSTKIIQNAGSCYSTIFEIEPGIIFMQNDQWYCRIKAPS